MTDLQKLLQYVQPEIGKINKEIIADLDSLEGEFDPILIEILRYGLLGSGKRFRPLLAVIAARICGGGVSHVVYRLAIAFEYLHLATLIHDDVIDNSENRRGRSSVFKKYGLSSAILAGDFLHARSMAIIGELGGRAALEIFCHATEGMVDGEFLQMRNAYILNQSEEDYFQAIKGKTALLIAATSQIGALYGGGGMVEQAALHRYGASLGCAFQVVDDLLDYLGDEKKTGKAVGNDLIEGKMTLPVIYTLNICSGKEKERLLEILGSSDERSRGYAEVVSLIDRHNGFTYGREMAESLVADALKELEIFKNKDSVKREKSILQGLAQYVLTREK
jgi:octaprenyl-diphosphate synthase